MKKLGLIINVPTFTFIYYLLCIYVGKGILYFKILLIIIIHEICHYLVAYFFQFEIKELVLLPFGAYLKINHMESYPLVKRTLVAIAGPFANLLLSFVLYDELLFINQLMMIFNLLPIYPLDGYHILLYLLDLFFNYHIALYLSYYISLVILILLIIYCYYDYLLLIYAYITITLLLSYTKIEDRYLLYVYYKTINK